MGRATNIEKGLALLFPRILAGLRNQILASSIVVSSSVIAIPMRMLRKRREETIRCNKFLCELAEDMGYCVVAMWLPFSEFAVP
jgi:hypothetical protein